MSWLDYKPLHEAIEYDFLTRGFDIADVFTGDLSVRRAWLLVTRLPADSETKSELRKLIRESGKGSTTRLEELPPETYSHTDWLLHDISSQLRIANYYAEVELTKKPPKKPEFLPAPTGVPRRKKTLSAWSAFAAAANNA